MKVLPVHTLSFVSKQTGQPVAEIKFNAGEAFLEKSEKTSEILTIDGEFKANWVYYTCLSVDYDVMGDVSSRISTLRGKNWKSLCLIAFNTNKYKLGIYINGCPMYSDELQWTEFER